MTHEERCEGAGRGWRGNNVTYINGTPEWWTEIRRSSIIPPLTDEPKVLRVVGMMCVLSGCVLCRDDVYCVLMSAVMMRVLW